MPPRCKGLPAGWKALFRKKAVVDTAFGRTDLLVILAVKRINGRYIKSLRRRRLSRFAA